MCNKVLHKRLQFFFAEILDLNPLALIFCQPSLVSDSSLKINTMPLYIRDPHLPTQGKRKSANASF